MKNKKDLEIYEDLEKQFTDEKLDFWTKSRTPEIPIQLFTPPETTLKIKNYLISQNYNFNITTKNWNKIAKPKTIRRLSSNLNNVFQHSIYHSYDEIIDFLKLQEKKHKEFVSVGKYGESHEKRLLHYIKIGYSNGKEKPMVVIDAGIDAREWVTHSSILIIVDNLVKNVKKYREILEKVDVIIIPVLNPDGYVYSITEDRMWRGNRNLNDNKRCAVDLNRNYPFFWRESDGTCQRYPGTYRLSERESMYHAFHMDKFKHLIKGYITLHSYGRLILLPWSHTLKANAPHYEEMLNLGNKMKEEIKSKKNIDFKVGSFSNILYPCHGTSSDYAKSLGVKYVYVVELSPEMETNSNGFIVDEDQITTIGDEALIIFDVMLRQVYSEI
uniref:Peptidase_M14 domain-containing protein n=1 Tax=Strongyloides venezuelensis TaxID=75913 RepID=A0A0K0FV93_STRVS